MTATMAAAWAPIRQTETVEKSVNLTGAPDIIALGGPLRPKTIRFQFTRHNGGTWHAQVTIYAERPGALMCKFFSPDKVYRAPQWLTDLIDSATPKD